MRAWGIALWVAMLTACAPGLVDRTQESVPDEPAGALPSASGQPVEIGERHFLAARQMTGGELVVDAELVQYVQRVGSRVAAVAGYRTPFEFAVVDGSVPNVWSLPGGRIAVTRGLLMQFNCEAQLAAVLAHEITHASGDSTVVLPSLADTSDHEVLRAESAEILRVGVSENVHAPLAIGHAALVANLIARRFEPAAELLADRRAMLHLQRAGYDPAVLLDMQRSFMRLANDGSPSAQADWRNGWLQRHPPSNQRLQALKAIHARLDAGDEPARELGCERYQQAMSTLIELAPTYAAYDRGVRALRAGDLDEAQANAREALALLGERKPNPKFYGLMGDVALASGALASAFAYYHDAVQLNPGYFKYYLEMGLIAHRLNENQEAARLIEVSMSTLPTATGAFHLGRISHQAGDVEMAVRYYRLAATSDSDMGRAAARELVLIDLPRHPERYVSVEPRIDRRGRVWMVVQNRAPVPVGEIVIEAKVAGGGPVQIETGTEQPLEPGEAARVPTPIGPLENPGAIRLVEAQVQAAQVVRQ